MFSVVTESKTTTMHPSKIARRRQRKTVRTDYRAKTLSLVRLRFFLEHDNSLLIVMPVRDPTCKNVIYDAISIEINIPKGRRSTFINIKVPTSHARVTDTYLRQLCREQPQEVAEANFMRFFHGEVASVGNGALPSSSVWQKVLSNASLFLRGTTYTSGAAC